ncbi:MAG: hypothetical protein ACKO96_27410, partial [Flammeovirgaceae bacterium]
MKHKSNLLKIFIRKEKAYLSYEIIAHLNLSPGERLSFQNEYQKSFLKIHGKSDKSGARVQVKNKNGMTEFFIKIKESLPSGCYIFNANAGQESSLGGYLMPLYM